MDEDTPVLDTLAAMTAVSIENSTLGNRELMLVPHRGPRRGRRARDLVPDERRRRGRLRHHGRGRAGRPIAVAPIIGTARTVSAAVNITEALGFAIAAVAAELEDELEAMEARRREA